MYLLNILTLCLREPSGLCTRSMGISNIIVKVIVNLYLSPKLILATSVIYQFHCKIHEHDMKAFHRKNYVYLVKTEKKTFFIPSVRVKYIEFGYSLLRSKASIDAFKFNLKYLSY